MIPAFVFQLALWAAYAGVAAGASYLLVVLFKEWRNGVLW